MRSPLNLHRRLFFVVMGLLPLLCVTASPANALPLAALQRTVVVQTSSKLARIASSNQTPCFLSQRKLLHCPLSVVVARGYVDYFQAHTKKGKQLGIHLHLRGRAKALESLTVSITIRHKVGKKWRVFARYFARYKKRPKGLVMMDRLATWPVHNGEYKLNTTIHLLTEFTDVSAHVGANFPVT